MDKYIIGQRSSGKTRKMLEAAKESGAVVLCKNPTAMIEKARNYGIFGVEILGYGDIVSHDIKNGTFVAYREKIAIDDMKEFFAWYFGTNLDAFTLTVE